jgi:tRNA1Val (adenine37-N6)-methyltransferase
MKVTTDACLFGAWVSNQLKSANAECENILDIGAGTGLLSLMIAQQTNSVIDAIEIDTDACAQARENIAASPWSNRITIFHQDARKFLFPEKYDLIISNPPFYEKELKSADRKRNLALHGNELTLDDLLKMIQQNLSLRGRFYLLLPYKRREELNVLFQKYSFRIHQILFIRPSVMQDYFRMIVTGTKDPGGFSEIIFDELSIQDEKQAYTKEFIELLQEYYLYI